MHLAAQSVCLPNERPGQYNCTEGRCKGRHLSGAWQRWQKDLAPFTVQQSAFVSDWRRTIADVVKSRVSTDATSW